MKMKDYIRSADDATLAELITQMISVTAAEMLRCMGCPVTDEEAMETVRPQVKEMMEQEVEV